MNEKLEKYKLKREAIKQWRGYAPTECDEQLKAIDLLQKRDQIEQEANQQFYAGQNTLAKEFIPQVEAKYREEKAKGWRKRMPDKGKIKSEAISLAHKKRPDEFANLQHEHYLKMQSINQEIEQNWMQYLAKTTTNAPKDLDANEIVVILKDDIKGNRTYTENEILRKECPETPYQVEVKAQYERNIGYLHGMMEKAIEGAAQRYVEHEVQKHQDMPN